MANPLTQQSKLLENHPSFDEPCPSYKSGLLPSPNVEDLDIGGCGDSNFADIISPSVPKSSTSKLNVTPEPSSNHPDAEDIEGRSQNHDINHISARASTVSTTVMLGPAKITQKTFSYKLLLKSIEFCRKAELGIWQLSLHHPKAHTPLTLTNVTVREISKNTFRNIELVLYFSAEVIGIRSIIESEPCVLHIKGPHGFVATAELDNGTLLDQIDMVHIHI